MDVISPEKQTIPAQCKCYKKGTARPDNSLFCITIFHQIIQPQLAIAFPVYS